MCQAMYKRQRTVLPKDAAGVILDPQDRTQQATFSADEKVKIGDHLVASKEHKDTQHMAMMLLMCGTAGRGDDCRERRLCELMKPMLRTCIGGSGDHECWCSAASVKFPHVCHDAMIWVFRH